MREDEKELYKKVFAELPVRTGKLKDEVLNMYDRVSNEKVQTFQFVISAAVVMIVVLLLVIMFPKNDNFPFIVYAANGEYVQLGKDAISLKPKCEPYLLTNSTLNTKQNEAYSCVFGFDIQCEAEDIKKTVYKIQGERTVSHISEFYKNSVWFVEVSDKEYKQDNMDFPFNYRYIETEDIAEVYTYLGSELDVEEKKRDERKYYIEYRIGKDEHGNWYAESFDIQVIIEKKDGTVIEKKLAFEPVFEMGEVCVNELWVKVE